MKEPLLKLRPGERAIILDENGKVIYSDFEPDHLRKETHLKLFDVLGEHNMDLMKLLEGAREPDTRQMAGTLSINGTWWDIRIVHIESGDSPDRTHIYFSPFKALDINN